MFVFDKEQLERYKKTEYFISTDLSKPGYEHHAYTLARKVDDKVEIILCDQMSDKDRFTETVNNLSKYFNATILKS